MPSNRVSARGLCSSQNKPRDRSGPTTQSPRLGQCTVTLCGPPGPPLVHAQGIAGVRASFLISAGRRGRMGPFFFMKKSSSLPRASSRPVFLSCWPDCLAAPPLAARETECLSQQKEGGRDEGPARDTDVHCASGKWAGVPFAHSTDT